MDVMTFKGGNKVMSIRSYKMFLFFDPVNMYRDLS